MSAPESAPGSGAGISIREFARRESCSDRLVRRAIKNGRIAVLSGGVLDPALVGTGWRRDSAKDADSEAADSVRSVRTPAAPHNAPPPLPKMPAEAEGLVTTEAAAALLMITAQWLRQLIKKGYVAQTERGQVQLGAAVRGYIRFLKDEERLATKAAARSRIDAARAEQIELRVAMLRKELVSVDEVLARQDVVIATFISALDGVPARITRDMMLRNKIRDEIDYARGLMADQFQKYADELEAAIEKARVDRND